MKYLLTTCLLVLLLKNISSLDGVWRWKCVDDHCQKTEITPETEATALSLQACRIICSKDASLWPKPTGTLSVGKDLVNISSIHVDILEVQYGSSTVKLLARMVLNFQKQVINSQPREIKGGDDNGKHLEITIVVSNPDINQLTLDTDESYTLTVSETSDDRLNATIASQTIFGARHGLQTLAQLIIYNDLRHKFQISKDIQITDKPAYPYRGILLDTARNYISVDAIKRTLDAMGASKLNRFHWHITDTHSFPFVSQSLPDLSKYGAYSTQKVYTHEDIAHLVQYGLERGVRVIPEFDAPAHVGEGWQTTDYVVRFNAKPWQKYCFEPPCGQFDPTKSRLYDTLEALYGDLLRAFQPDIFHMGGDEVNFGSWNSTESIVAWMQREKNWGRSDEDFVKLWSLFQNESLTRLHKQAGYELPVIMWTSTLTEKKYLHHLPKDKYIIQIWTSGTDPQVRDLLRNGYRVILSNYDALYFDCGFASWVGGGNNWCSPYIGWQKVYQNNPAKIAGDKKYLVLGSEAALWTEQVDSVSVDGRLWPRAAALAEVLWSEPEGTWREAEKRMLVHRERLVRLGVNADALEPEWCTQYEESCPIEGKLNE